jgi:penicillin-insensitive murein DD-endopeptidase
MTKFRLLFSLALLLPNATALAQSTCYGTTSNGRIEGAVPLASRGENFTPYSETGIAFGRTYVHKTVGEVVALTYRELGQVLPGTKFVYGETGWKSGGSFAPHRTHQNGLSVDFMVPVRNAKGKSVALPVSITNKFGYNIEFSAAAKFGEYEIDFEAIGEHLYQLDLAAKNLKAPIKLVIFDPAFLRRLLATKHGAFLRANVKFMQGNAWVRHDEHYHVDFDIPCKTLKR